MASNSDLVGFDEVKADKLVSAADATTEKLHGFDEVNPSGTGLGFNDIENKSGMGFDQVQAAPSQPRRTTFDVTVGAVGHGGADTAELLSRGVNRSFLDKRSSTLEDFANTMQKFKKDHPEYAPIEVDSVGELLSRPDALSSKLFGNAAYLGLQAGTVAIPGYGWVIAGTTAYTIEAQRAYTQAKDLGASEDEAVMAGKMTGTVNSAIQVLTDLKLLNVAKGERGLLTRRMLDSSRKVIRSLGPAAAPFEDAAMIGALGAAQGAVNEGIALSVYQKPIDKGWLDRRLQEGAVGAATSVLMGAGSRIYRKVLGGTPEKPGASKQVEVNVFDRNSAAQFLNSEGAPEDVSKAMATIGDGFASNWSVNTKAPKEQWFSSVINEENYQRRPEDSTGKALSTDTESLLNSFDQDANKVVDVFLGKVVENLPNNDKDALKASLKITDKTPPEVADRKMQKAFVRYLWDGEAPAPEFQDSFKTMRELLKDVYKTVSATGARKISLQTRTILDNILSPDTPEISQEKQRIQLLEKAITEGFGEKAKPSSRLTPDELKKLMEPIEIKQTTYEIRPGDEFATEVTSSKTRKRTPSELSAAINQAVEAKKSPADIQAQQEAAKVQKPVEGLERTRQEAELLLSNAYAELDRMRHGRLVPEEQSGVALRSKSDGYPRDVLNQEFPADTQKRVRIWDHFDNVRSWFDISAPLRRFSWGRKILDMTGDAVAFAKKTSGEYEESIVETFRALNWKERKWLQQADSLGITNMRKMIEGGPDASAIPPTPNLKEYRDLSWRINNELGAMAERMGVLMRYPSSGEIQPYKQPPTARMLRFMTDDARSAIQKEQGPLYRAIVQSIETLNPELKGQLGKIKEVLKNSFVDPEIKKNSALETARVFKVVPDVVTVEGKQVQILHTDPLRYLRQAVRSQAHRLGWAKVFGQDLIDTVKSRELRTVASELGVSPKTDEFAVKQRIRERIFNLDEQKAQRRLDQKAAKKNEQAKDVGQVKQELQQTSDQIGAFKSGDQPDFLDDVKTLKDSIRLARELGISVQPTRQEYIDAIGSVTATQMGAKEYKNLQKIARRIKGIDAELPVADLLSEIKRRTMEDNQDVVDVLMKNLSAESEGHADVFAMDVLKASQGIPLKVLNRTLGLRVARTTSTILGTLQTSMSVLRNIPQTAFLVPYFGGFGNYIKAVDYVLKNPRLSKHDIVALGAMPETVYSYGIEKGYALESTGRIFRQLFSTATGLRYVADFNNTVAGETFRRLSLEWRKPGAEFSSSDLATMRSLKLTEKEISQVRAGRMTDLTHAKIVQEGVSLTQFVTESGHRRGRIEHSPIASMVFAYSQYAIGTGRAVAQFFNNTVIPAAKGDKKLIGPALFGLGALLTNAVGTGMYSQILVDAAKGDATRRLDDSTIDRMLSAVGEVALVGPTQRMLDAFKFGDAQSWVTGMMPQIGAIQDGLNMLWNEYEKAVHGKAINTKYARAGFGTGLAEFAKSNIPAVKAIAHWADMSMYPKGGEYTEAKAASAKYLRDRKDVIGGSSNQPLNPLHEEVYFYVARGDIKKSMDAAGNFYAEYMKQFVKDPIKAMQDGKTPDKAFEELHQSLISRAPINMNEMKKIDFLLKLPQDRMKKYFQTDTEYRTLVDLVAPTRQ